MSGSKRARRLTDELRKAGVSRVAFFCNSPTREPDGQERLRFFADQGHLIANQSASHPDLTKTSLADYTKDIELADRELRALPNFRKWFRFPFLHERKDSKTEAYTDPTTLREPSSSVKLTQGRISALAQERHYPGPYYSKWNKMDDIRAEFCGEGVW